MTRATLAALAATTAFASAQTPTYSTHQIMASTGDILFNLPAGASISSVTPSINASGKVAFKFLAPNSTNIWFGGLATGQTIQTVDTSVDFYLLSDPDCNDDERVVWAQDGPGAPAVWSAVADGSAAMYATGPLGTAIYGSPSVNAVGQVGYRASFSTGRAWVTNDPAGDGVRVLAAEQSIQPGSNISYLYTPTMNDLREVAGKMSRSVFAQEEIWILGRDPQLLIAQSNELDSDSPFDKFDNAVGFNNAGQVAFITTLVGGVRAIYLSSDYGQYTEIAREGVSDVSDIEFFHPVVNDDGLVAFRAFDGAGRRAVFVGDGASLTKAAVEGAAIRGPNDEQLFIGRFIDTSPAFGGSPDINAHGDVVFNAQLHDTVDLRGAAIIVAFADDTDCAVDLTGEGDVNTNDFFQFLAYYQAQDPRADFSPGGGINTNDFFAFLGAYQAGC